VAAIVGSAFYVAVVTDSFSHLPIVLMGIGAGLWAMQAATTRS